MILFEFDRIQEELNELSRIVNENKSSPNKLPRDAQARIEAIERKVSRIEKRLTDSQTSFDLARDFTWHELKNICVKVKIF